MFSRTRSSYLIKEMLLKKGVKNLLEFSDQVSKSGLKLASIDELTSKNLQDSNKNKDNGFFKSNRISKKYFYKEAKNIIRDEVLRQKANNLSGIKSGERLNIFNPQFYFDKVNNIGRDNIKKASEPKETLWGKFFWFFFIPILATIIAGIILIELQ